VVVVDRGGVVFDGPRDVFIAREAEVLHEHHNHHHDHELYDSRPSLTGNAEAGPTGRAS
jgi:hypothetical protein